MAEPAIRAPGEGELRRTENRDLGVRASWEQMNLLEYAGREDFDIFDVE